MPPVLTPKTPLPARAAFVGRAAAFVAAGALGAFFWTLSLYQIAVPPPRFPRQPSEFRAPAALDAAVAAAQSILAKDPENMPARMDLAVAFFEQGPDHYVEALEHLEKARELGVLDDRLFYYAGVMYEAKGLLEYAAPDLERYLRHHPSDLETRLRLGNLYYRVEGDLDRSIDCYKKILEKKPRDPLVSFNLAMALRDRKNFQEGLDVLAPLLEGDNALPTGGWKLLGDLRRGVGDNARALDDYNAELTKNGDNADLASAMAQTLEALGRPEESLAAWEKVLRFDPKNTDAKSGVRRVKKQLAKKR